MSHTSYHKDSSIRYNWNTQEALELLEAPLISLIYQAQTLHKRYHEDETVQLANLLSIRTGYCPENCKYCPQSAHWAKKTGLQKEELMSVESVLEKALLAKEKGATRFCMGAAWREARDGKEFDQVLEMIKGVNALGLESCVTLGMVNEDQANRLADAGLKAYNHNLDTGPEYYDKIITTRVYEDRLKTLECVRKAGITVCSGGIIGMGESLFDRARMLETLANQTPHPESVPINALVPVEGTPLEKQESVSSFEMVRMIAAARIMMPASRVRLSAGRHNLSKEAQILCFLAGANSIFYGEKLLTTPNNDMDEDISMIKEAGLKVLSLS